ncbi:hypothetical protein K9L67_00540 [Candidatus Woesearchaeota archaeon]|nr:hypothetical protein [Candidatus Woesearchaeota archaeon]MCF7900694.1 hypothetical protein [Candidatus Woesearchaeota archaeon]MCF8013215.1 hypothetical protein [Candidatus Woesearchaeota archaeon]
MGKEILEKILNLLSSKNIFFEHLIHTHVHSSEDAAKIRGNSVGQAAKAIILKCKKRNGDYEFIQYVLPGDKVIDFKSFRKHFDYKSTSLAHPDEVLEITGCVIGSVPPVGPLFGIRSFFDESVLCNEFIFFSAGTHFDSVKIKSKDFMDLFDFEMVNFSLEK